MQVRLILKTAKHSLSPVSGDRKQLVVLLYGLTGKADDMLGVAGVWRHALPNAEFLIPTAKDNSWFPIMDYLQPNSSKNSFWVQVLAPLTFLWGGADRCLVLLT